MANNPWFRVWGEMVNDPKWRTIARISGQKIGDVMAIYLHMMTLASNATERGRTQGFREEDIATALDLNTEQVAAIRDAMQGRVLDGDYLTGWERRQPLREDGSSERGKQYREVEKLRTELENLKNERAQTQPNAAERSRTQSTAREEEIREEDISSSLRSEDSAAAPQRTSATKREEVTLAKYLETCKKSGIKPVPDDHAIRTWCLDAKIPIDMLQVAWVVFREKYLGDEKLKRKRYKKWDDHFANSVKDRWYGLWFIAEDGMPAWTSTGMQRKQVLETQQAKNNEETAHENA